MSGPLRVLLTADPEIPVPPRHYGGIERIVDLLATGLAERGHRVALLAHPDSRTAGRLFPYAGRRSQSLPYTLLHAAQLAGAVREFRPDLVHSFGRVAYLLPVLPSRLPKVQSYQRAIAPRSVAWGTRLSGGSLTFTACSTSCRRPVSHVGSWETIYNAVRLADYAFRPSAAPDAPLVFLGRLERIKGAHTAIAVARATGRRLVLAGNVVDHQPHRRYYEEEIAPHVDGVRIRYVGPVDDAQKDDLLGGAAALLMPIEWEEPFGIVMAEALACGTPVIALRRGSVPEVVEHGVSGFVCDSPEEMVAAVGRIGALDRNAARERAERCFGDRVAVDAYQALYRRRLGEAEA